MKASLCLKYLDYTKGTGLDERGSVYKVSNSKLHADQVRCYLANVTGHYD